jgi:hypothetical protein
MHSLLRSCLIVAVVAAGCGKSDKPGGESKPAGGAAAPAPAGPAAAKPAAPPAADMGDLPEGVPHDPQPPYVVGAGGGRMPAGFDTSFTAPGGKRTTIPYTQVYASPMGKGMMVLLEASAQSQPGVPKIALVLDGGDVKSAKDLAGKTLSSDSSQLVLKYGEGQFLKNVRVTFSSATDDGAEGTFTADVFASPMDDAPSHQIADGTFKAKAGQFVTQEMIDAMSKGSRGR